MPWTRRNSLHLRIVAASAALMVLVAVNARPQELRWYRGNTHAHPAAWGDSSGFTEKGAAWYASNGYDFLCITEGNRLTPPSAIRLPADVRKDFILIPAEEIITMSLNATAMNIRTVVAVPFVGESLSSTLQECLQAAENARGHPHPQSPQPSLGIDRCRYPAGQGLQAVRTVPLLFSAAENGSQRGGCHPSLDGEPLGCAAHGRDGHLRRRVR